MSASRTPGTGFGSVPGTLSPSFQPLQAVPGPLLSAAPALKARSPNVVGIPISACIAEFVGTFLLILTVGCNVLSNNGTWGAVSIACVLMVNIYAFGAASGAHFNPAVSFALALAKKFKFNGGWKQAAVYMVVQVAGGLTAALCYGLFFGTAFPLAPKPGHTSGALLCEFLYTFMLCFVVLNTACSQAKGGGKNQYFGLAIGFVIIAGGYGAGAVGAGCFNPAVALSIFASSKFFLVAGSSLTTCLAYILVELAGAALAVFLFQLVRPEEKDENSLLMPPAASPAFLDAFHTRPASTRTLTRAGALGYDLQSKLISELIGTFMLVFTVGLNVLGGSPAGAFSIAAALTCMIYAIGDVSGGHFNPAVTLAIQLCGKGASSTTQACQYVGAQVVGAILGAFSYAFVHGKTFSLGPGIGHGWTDVALAEFMFTFVLTFVVLGVAVVDNKPAHEFVGLIIGSCVTVGGCAIGTVSGACLNPAVSLGVATSHILGGGFFYKAIFYGFFQLLGGAAAAGMFRAVYPEEVENLDIPSVQKVRPPVGGAWAPQTMSLSAPQA
jgi:aquaporin Z